MIACSEAVEHLWAYLDRDLDARDHRSVEDHLAYCVQCCGELEFAKHLRRLLGASSTGELPAEVRARLDQFIDCIDDTTDTAETP
jgi:mycothiol system anti-sigma-R factor